MKETISILLEKIKWDKDYFNAKAVGNDELVYRYFLGKYEYARDLQIFLEEVLKHLD